MQRLILLMSLLVLILGSRLLFASNVLLCGGAEVVEATVEQEQGRSALKEVWRWRPEESSGLPIPMMRKFITTDDCKSVKHGTEVLITSSGDAVALVSRKSGAALFYATVKNAHSATLLPGGLIAVAASDGPGGEGDQVVLFRQEIADTPVAHYKLTAAHGLEWDGKRNVLWALGGKVIAKLKLTEVNGIPHLQEEHVEPLPAPTGHDLQLSSDGSVLYVTNTKNVFSMDPDSMKFTLFPPFDGLQQIKSLSVDSTTGRIAFTQADHGVWWTYTLRFSNPKAEVVLPSIIYKVRWVEDSIDPAKKP
jgi:Family of unknown function (DUF6528)